MGKQQKYKTVEQYESSAEYVEEYKKGFNEGYLMAQHEPDLLNTLLESAREANDPHLIGMYHGKKQYDKERLLEQLKQSQERNKDKGSERGF